MTKCPVTGHCYSRSESHLFNLMTSRGRAGQNKGDGGGLRRGGVRELLQGLLSHGEFPPCGVPRTEMNDDTKCIDSKGTEILREDAGETKAIGLRGVWGTGKGPRRGAGKEVGGGGEIRAGGEAKKQTSG